MIRLKFFLCILVIIFAQLLQYIHFTVVNTLEEVQQQINPGHGDSNGEVNVDLRLTALKHLHASWLVNLCNHLSSDIGRPHVAKEWEKADIAKLLDESFSLSLEDLFKVSKSHRKDM